MDKIIEVDFLDKKLKGTLVKEDNSHLTIKLESGYNIILNKNEIKVLSEKSIDKNDINKINSTGSQKEKNNGLPNILIIHTGGTIASKIDYQTGAVSSNFDEKELLNLYPEFLEKSNLTAIKISNILSENMSFKHLNLILKTIKENIDKNFDGIIIGHGTDTLHFTSSILSYFCQNLKIPIILVGAQRSSDRASSDAYFNLNSAIDFISYNKENSKKFNRVGVCMHKNLNDEEYLIFDGINLRKNHSSKRDAFKQINYNPFCELVYDFQSKTSKPNISILREDLLTKKDDTKTQINFINEDLNIGFFKTHPNLKPFELDSLKNYDGVVFEGTGFGHLGVEVFDIYSKENEKNLEELKKLKKNNVKMILSTQTIFGEINLNIYSTGILLKEIFDISNQKNLISETLFSRLLFCLSILKNKDAFEDIWNSNLEKFDINQNL